MTFKASIAFATLALVSTNASAMHMYASYECKAGNVELKYDGPGSNYAFGGYSNFYVKGKKAGSLAYENDGQEKVGNEVGESRKVQIIFTVVKTEKVGDVKNEGGGSECGSYDHSEWKTVRTIKIDDLSPAAAKKLGLKKGTVLKMSCDETQDEPSGDCSK